MGIKHTIQKRKVINLSITAFFAVSVLLPIDVYKNHAGSGGGISRLSAVYGSGV